MNFHTIQTPAYQFAERFLQVREEIPKGHCATPITGDELIESNALCFGTIIDRPGLGIGFPTVAGGYLIDEYIGGLWSALPGAGSHTLRELIEWGGAELSCYGEGLRDYYQRHGFRETLSAPWDWDLAPAHWPIGCGTPNYYEMRLN